MLNTVLGTIAGGQKDRSGDFSDTRSTSSVSLRDFNDINKGRSEAEALGYDQSLAQFKDLLGLVSQGPGASEVSANTSFQNSFASQLQGLLSQITNPTQANINQNYQTAQSLFAPQQELLKQSFQDQSTEANRMAARLGRAGNDPILRNKLAQEQTRQSNVLNAEIGAYARNLPTTTANNVMNVGGYLANLRQGLATQAMNNRQNLMALGNELASSERNYRLQTATKTGSQTTNSSQYSGGGLKGAITGFTAGRSADISQIMDLAKLAGGGGMGG